MAKKGKISRGSSGKILLIILIIAILFYLGYVYLQKQKGTEGSGGWHTFDWGGAQMNSTEVLLCCDDNVQNELKLGDQVEIKVDGCVKSFTHINSDPNHNCHTKTCVCRMDINGIHEVVGFGDDAGPEFSTKGFRIKADWVGRNLPNPSIIDGRWRKVAKTSIF